MPMIITKDHLYQKYSDALQLQTFTKNQLISIAHFRKMFSSADHKHIKFPHFCVLGQCTTCASTNDMLSTRLMSPSERSHLKKLKIHHLKLVEAERKVYHLHQQEELTDPGRVFSVVMDGSTYVFSHCWYLCHQLGRIFIFTS
jgi:hypothetical protein